MPEIARGYGGTTQDQCISQNGRKSNTKKAQWPLSPTEKSAKLAPFRLIVPLCEKRTAFSGPKIALREGMAITWGGLGGRGGQ